MKSSKSFIANMWCVFFLSIFSLASCSEEEILTQDLRRTRGTPPGLTTTTLTSDTNTSSAGCSDVASVDLTRPACTETLAWDNEVNVSVSGNTRTITSNNIPDHMVGLFGGGNGSLNPNAISEIFDTYRVTTNPQRAANVTPLLSTNTGPQYMFGVLLNGVLIDPEAAEPWPHTRPVNFNMANWEWNLDAMSINLGLDCNNAHVQPTGKYHYHGSPRLYLESLGARGNAMTLIGYAGDGFPIYNKYGYTDANSASSGIKALISSYQLKRGERPGDGVDAPCGDYTGIYTADYEYVPGAGDLDECNGRIGVTPEYPEGIYYYVITDQYPFVGRCLAGTPGTDFSLR